MDQAVDFSGVIASLRMAGADQTDPVRFHYIEALANRAVAHHGSVRRILDGKLAEALEAFGIGFEQAQSAAKDTIAKAKSNYPHAADDLQRLFVAGDFGGVERFIDTLKQGDPRASLGDLARYITQHSSDTVDGNLKESGGAHAELKTIRNFRNTWSKLSVDKQVTQAIEQAPENAGPLNSHMLVVRSLALMRDISPDYLNRFVSYVDTLLCLDRGVKRSKPMEKTADGEGAKQMKARRGRSAPSGR